MGLWRCNPDQALKEFEEYNKEDNNLIFKMFVPDKRIMKNLTSSDKGTVSTFYPPRRKLDTNIILHEQEQQKLILQIQDSDSADENKTMSSDSNADMEISHATDTLEEDQYQIFLEQRKVKNKSPSQKKRDRNRLIEFRRRIRENKNEDGLNVTNKKEIGVQTEKKKTWRRRWLQLFTPSDRTGNECVIICFSHLQFSQSSVIVSEFSSLCLLYFSQPFNKLSFFVFINPSHFLNP